MKYKKKLFLLLLLLVATVMAGLYFGSAVLPPADFFAAFFGVGSETNHTILFSLRLPRIAAGILAGVGLAPSGVLLQTVTANELASPNIIGINSGAGLAVILTLTMMPGAAKVLPLAAFVGAFGGAMCILLAADRLSGSRSAILLIGIAITTLLNAAISFLSLLDEDVLAQYNHFTVGSLKAVYLDELRLPALIIVSAFLAAMLLSGQLGTLCLGDSAAAALGVRVKRLRIGALACAAAGSFAGLLGFAGLIVPHIARYLVGGKPARMLPVAALLGAVIVVLADLLGRTLFAPSELPVGILMSLMGAPYFLILLCRRRQIAPIS